MASVHGLLLLLPLTVLLALLATITDPTACAPGTMAIPILPLPSCRIYAVSRACGLGGPYGPQDPSPVLKERCCRELAAVPQRCRCAALGFMMDGEPGRLQDFPGCSREAQRWFARRLTRGEECICPPSMVACATNSPPAATAGVRRPRRRVLKRRCR